MSTADTSTHPGLLPVHQFGVGVSSRCGWQVPGWGILQPQVEWGLGYAAVPVGWGLGHATAPGGVGMKVYYSSRQGENRDTL